MAAKIAGAPVVWPPAEQRGYVAELCDATGRPLTDGGGLAGAVLFNPDGDPIWVPVEDFSAVGDLLIRLHVQAGRMRGKR